MLFKRINIATKLAKVRDKSISEEELLASVYALLEKDNEREKRIQQSLSNNSREIINDFNFDLLETKNIFHINQIRETCIDYRLRFLNTSYFKGDIPLAAINKIKKLEELHDIEIQGYKIMAPSKLFRLEDKDDPLLFAPIGNDYFYLIHKWGKDLHPFRRILVWPFKNIINLALLVVLMSYAVSLMVPDGLFSKNNSAAEFWIIFFFMFKSIAAIVIFYGFALGKNFNPAIWRSKYL
ncbi:hypothetical protein [Muriicola sp. Z0-33]|uniref:hypothetical protein n=1 Tax=Muriicola sp. Z0-33 TaxID=2816957 RepID=UPI002237C144|nr:hypothetical protein [Muriicola sp. Z0-33]MCW5516578.1 hypothetical protein [Muriicola sp. Z0-33]